MTTSIKDKSSELAAKRWAKALIELAGEQSEVSYDDVLRDLKLVEETISSSEELSDVINNPSVAVEEKQIVICKLFQERIMPIVYNFVYVLNLRKRLGIISQIVTEFEKELDKIKNIVHVSVVSAIELSDEKKDSIKEKLAEKLQKNVVTEWSENSEIIAGLVFDINETIVDNSVRRKLEDLSNKIIKG